MTVSFFRMVPDIVPPMPAEKTALGTLPLPAFQYCEAVRTATSLGWYIFPPRDIVLQFDGRDIHVLSDQGSYPLSSELIGPDFSELWNQNCPPDLENQEIAWMSSLSYPGIFQLWSGYFIETKPGWSTWIKPITNLLGSSSVVSFEAIIETDQFKPAPLFSNFRITKTDTPIFIRATEPMFQIVSVPNEIMAPNQTATEMDVFAADGTEAGFDWDGYCNTTRSHQSTQAPGKYGAEIRRKRKRSKQDDL